MEKLKREVGNWVDGDRFWDRENEVKELIKLLEEGANVIIAAQRRIGKTSLIREVGRRMEVSNICLQLDLEKSHSPADFVTELSMATRPFSGLWANITDVFSNILSGVGKNIDSIGTDELTIKFRDGLSSDWQAKAERVTKALAESEKPVIIFMDEFPLLVNWMLRGFDSRITPERLEVTDSFLSWVRAMTMKYKNKIRFVATGSIGLEPILRQARLSSRINTFMSFELCAWNGQTAADCLQALAANYGVTFEPDAIDRLVDLIGCCIPHHVQMFFSNIYMDCNMSGNMSVSPNDVGRIYRTRMLSIRGHAELSTYEERLKGVIKDEMLPLAFELLTEAAVTGRLTIEAAKIICEDHFLSGKEQAEVLRDILSILEHDGYLERKDNNYVFVSKLVRDWWKSRFDFQYIPASERNNRP